MLGVDVVHVRPFESPRATDVEVSQITCQSCWSTFEISADVLAGDEDLVTCPLCGMTQTLEPDEATDGGSTDDGSETGPAADDQEYSDAGIPTPDQVGGSAHPWRVRSPTGLVLLFPDIRHAMEFSTDMNEARMGLARGEEPFRSLGMFRSRLTPRIDPEVIFDSLPYEEHDEQGSPLSGDDFSPLPSIPLPQDELGRELEAARTRRPRTIQKEFAFRTGMTEASWAERILLMFFGLVVGGGVIYYLAWLGMLPGIRY